MVTIWQAVKREATARPIIETRNSWLSLLNFMRFLRRGPSGSSPKKTRLGCPAIIVKAHCGVLLRMPFPPRRREPRGLSLLRAGARAVMRNCGDRRRLGVGRVRRILRIDQRAGGGTQQKA